MKIIEISLQVKTIYHYLMQIRKDLKFLKKMSIVCLVFTHEVSKFYQHTKPHIICTYKFSTHPFFPQSKIVWYTTTPLHRQKKEKKTLQKMAEKNWKIKKGRSMPESIIKIPWASFIKLKCSSTWRGETDEQNGKRVKAEKKFLVLCVVIFSFFLVIFLLSVPLSLFGNSSNISDVWLWPVFGGIKSRWAI